MQIWSLIIGMQRGALGESVAISVIDPRPAIVRLRELPGHGRVGTHLVDDFLGAVEAAEASGQLDTG